MGENKETLKEGKTISNKKEQSDKPKPKINPAPQKVAEKIINKTPDYEKLLEKSKEENVILNDKYLRLHAEFDNFRKRTTKEKIDLSKSANEKIILDILPIIDNFERAKPLSDGISLIYKDLQIKLINRGVSEIVCDGVVFDTDLHEAISILPIEDKESGTIIEVVEKGYKLNGKVIRFSKVVVAQ